jgi:uncharacterized protein (UPF0332 family)
MDKLLWCFKIKTGLRLTSPNENLHDIYEKKSINSLKLLKSTSEEFTEWLATFAYYAIYYRCYSLLLRIGVRSENHACTIEMIKHLEKKLSGPTIHNQLEKYKEKREIAQYYTGKIGISKERMLKDVLALVDRSDKMDKKLNGETIKSIRKELQFLLRVS